MVPLSAVSCTWVMQFASCASYSTRVAPVDVTEYIPGPTGDAEATARTSSPAFAGFPFSSNDAQAPTNVVKSTSVSCPVALFVMIEPTKPVASFSETICCPAVPDTELVPGGAGGCEELLLEQAKAQSAMMQT